VNEAEADVAAELRALREEVASLRAELGARDEPVAADAGGRAPPSFNWVSSLEAPARRRLVVPRLLLEGAFLIAVAAVAALAELEPLVIAAVMGGAWLLVALAEWAGSRADRRRDELLYSAPMAAEPVADPAWFSPPVEQTMLDGGLAADSETAVAKLPPLPEGERTANQS
jgi:hypothetical protein